MSKIQQVPGILEAALETFKERNKTYGNSADMHGNVMEALFPNGISIVGAEGFQRFSLLNLKITKLVRYCNNFEQGGHLDSIHDDGVYSFMLEAYTNPEPSKSKTKSSSAKKPVVKKKAVRR
jgi:hypothetical protein